MAGPGRRTEAVWAVQAAGSSPRTGSCCRNPATDRATVCTVACSTWRARRRRLNSSLEHRRAIPRSARVRVEVQDDQATISSPGSLPAARRGAGAGGVAHRYCVPVAAADPVEATTPVAPQATMTTDEAAQSPAAAEVTPTPVQNPESSPAAGADPSPTSTLSPGSRPVPEFPRLAASPASSPLVTDAPVVVAANALPETAAAGSTISGTVTAAGLGAPDISVSVFAGRCYSPDGRSPAPPRTSMARLPRPPCRPGQLRGPV